MRKYLYILFILIFSSCSRVKHGENVVDYSAIGNLQKVEGKLVVVDIKDALDLQATDFMRKNIEGLDVLQLDGVMPIGKVSKMCIAKNMIVLLAENNIFGYNQQTGRLVYHVNRRGNGHNEYRSLRDIQILEDNNEILAIDDLGKSYFYFDLTTGKFLYKENSLIGTSFACKYEGLYFSSVTDGNDFNENETWGLLVSDSIRFRGKQFRLRPLQCVDFVTDNINVHNQKLYFVPLFSDTVYVVNKHLNIVPSFVVKQKKSLSSIIDEDLNFANVLEMMHKRGYTFMDGSRFFESQEALFFKLLTGRGRGLGEECFVYDKRFNKLFRLLTEDLCEQQYAIFPHDILYVKENRFFGLYLDGQKLKDVCKLGNIKVENVKLSKLLSSKQINHNPIVVSFEYKR